MNIKNFIDLHVHVGPEALPRRYTVASLAKSEQGKLSEVVCKNHFYSTVPMVEALKSGLLIGSIVLNNYVGGLNADVVRAMADLSSRSIVVWFPTINATNFLEKSEFEIPPEWVAPGFQSKRSSEVQGIVILENGNLTIPAVKVLEAIKEKDCILATGHISWQETEKLVDEAIRMGIQKIIVTHPIYQKVAMPVEVQKRLASMPGVFIESNYAMYLIDKIPIQEIVRQIEAVKTENCIISSDMGQVNTPSPSEGLQNFTQLLLKEGLTKEEIEVMGVLNPRKLLGKNI